MKNLPTYSISWMRGRRAGAIGAFYPGSLTVKASSEEQALLEVYKTHEHLLCVRITKLTGQPS